MQQFVFAQASAVTAVLGAATLAGLFVIANHAVLQRLSKEFCEQKHHSERQPTISEVLSWVIQSLWNGSHMNTIGPSRESLWNDLWMLSIILVYLILNCATAITIFARWDCLLMSRVGNSLYMFAKGSLYLCLVNRARNVYAGSVYGYSRRSITIINTCITIVIIIDWMTLLWTTKLDKTIKYDYRVRRCVYKYQSWALLSVILTDLCASLLALTLLTRPLRKLLVNNNNHSNAGCSDQFQSKLAVTAKKITILTYVAVLSTMLVLTAVFTADSISPAPLDYAINSICLMLMTKPFQNVYPRLCFGPIWCADHCCGCDSTGQMFVEPTSLHPSTSKPQ